jgi:GTP-binding protein
VGLVGLPNAGKSTLLNALTNARAKVGAYPFTTVKPQLGVVSHKGVEFVVADIPGLIEGATEGAGIGDRFLGHIERCRILVHLVDAAGASPTAAYDLIRTELERYGAGLDEKPELVVLSRVDAADRRAVANAARAIERRTGEPPLLLSAHSGEGLDTLLDRLVAVAGRARPEAAPAQWSPL